ncbi:hypothetical protein GDO81_011229 [Engystomops pustulosus]|uniref:Uncharacterized protein n=1 Tax=Engystomops pustulosus TaxID=76066 RepID=A0AAV7BD27_ENGPU|nr:hypothetical protein GDO81_011229 [Engystomops pustulosus]
MHLLSYINQRPLDCGFSRSPIQANEVMGLCTACTVCMNVSGRILNIPNCIYFWKIYSMYSNHCQSYICLTFIMYNAINVTSLKGVVPFQQVIDIV